MTERSLRLLLVDADSLFRLGLRTYLEGFPDLQVVAETGTGQECLAILQDSVEGGASEPIAQTNESTATDAPIDVMILDLCLGQIHPGQMSGLELCQILRTEYPQLPVLLVSMPGESEPLTAAFQMGINGYCPKGTPVSDLVAAIRQVATGESSWGDRTTAVISIPPTLGAIGQLRQTLCQSGVSQIESALAEVNRQLQQPLSLIHI